MMQQYNAKVLMEKIRRVQCSGDSVGAIRNSVSLLSAVSLLAIVRGLFIYLLPKAPFVALVAVDNKINNGRVICH